MSRQDRRHGVHPASNAGDPLALPVNGRQAEEVERLQKSDLRRPIQQASVVESVVRSTGVPAMGGGGGGERERERERESFFFFFFRGFAGMVVRYRRRGALHQTIPPPWRPA